MFLTSSHSRRLIQLCYPLVASLLLVSSGCGHDHNSCESCTNAVSDSSTYRAYDAQPQVVMQSQIVTPPPVAMNDGAMRGPRSQAELDALFQSSRVQQLPPMPQPAPAQVAPPPQDSVVIVAPGEPSWNVPITREWHHIVIHHSASTSGNAASFDRAHREKGWDGLGYHFVIGNGNGSGDGQVEVGYRWTKQMQGAHAGNYEYNQHGIGICLVGDFEHGGPPSARQMASLRTLVSFLQSKTGIPPSEIIGHGNVPGRNTECPGRNLDVAAFRASLGGVYIQRSSAPAPTEKRPAPSKGGIIKAVDTEVQPAATKAVAAP